MKEIRQDDNKEFDEKQGLTNVLSGEEETNLVLELQQQEEQKMIRKRNIGTVFMVVFVLFFLILFPIPLYASNYIFSKSFFKGYIVVAFLWIFFSVGIVTIYPAIEALPTTYDLIRRIIQNDPVSKMHSDELVEHITAVTSCLQQSDQSDANKVLITGEKEGGIVVESVAKDNI